MKKVLLVLLFVISVFASSDEEIGVPYRSLGFEHDFGSNIKSATFSLDGNNMYTYSDGLVTIYETNPMKKVSSFHIEPDKSFRDNGQKIFVTKDKKRIIFYTRRYLQLWDIQTEKLLNKILLDSRNAVNSNSGLVILKQDGSIEILDDSNFKVIRKSISPYILTLGYLYESYNNKPFEVFVNNNIVLLRFIDGVMFVDLKTFKIIDKTGYGMDNREYIKKYEQDFPFVIKNLLKRDTRPHSNVYFLNSDNKQITIYTVYRSSDFFIKKYKNFEGKSLDRYAFFQNDDAWLLFDVKKRIFSGSKNVKKHMRMKTKDKKEVPINDATFKKYSRKIDLKD